MPTCPIIAGPVTYIVAHEIIKVLMMRFSAGSSFNKIKNFPVIQGIVKSLTGGFIPRSLLSNC